jgi:hypothetical protein
MNFSLLRNTALSLLSLCLGSYPAQASEPKEIARIWLDLDGDKEADRVTIVDRGIPGENYLLQVKLDSSGELLTVANVIPGPAPEGIWSVDPKYSLEKAGSGTFVLQLQAGDFEAYRSVRTYRYSISLRKGELVVGSFLAVTDELHTGDPDYYQSLNFRFLEGRILGKADSHHRDFHNRQGGSEPLPRGCRGLQPLSLWQGTQPPACSRDSAQRLEQRLAKLLE